MLRARQPDETGFVERNGIRSYWERFGEGDQTILFLPTWSIIHSRHWKFQIPYFARHFRVVTYDGWAKYNRHYWQRDYPGFVEFFLSEMFPEPHSTKQIEDGVSWGLETTSEVLIATHEGPGIPDEAAARELCARVRCPVLVIHGDRDRQVPHARGAALAEATGGTLVTMGGSGHAPHLRDPGKVNLLPREVLGEGERPRERRPRRSLRRRP